MNNFDSLLFIYFCNLIFLYL